ncbi:L-lactate permease [Mycolicibacterium vaccae]|uniref:L-lactate permease n=1 Tax=Mycolicibacterium vaccae ATCC 25954 TaxID=1194972 RepID=K0UNW3_MYCVA|nr:L-lactate permease [Mycolicibacterium vaccae]ANI42907.1 lactate transporter LctP family protein [Mycolicibacterium vaccae 95051]EJZ08511.1 L-lactate permease [Mycolicibacterium vaccae ATCC 25954]MCV7059433.1 L-lactate permease [Mycolicibacterium vaccae]
MYQQVLDPVAGSLAWSAAVAAVPLLLLFVLLGALKMTAWKAALISLAVSIAVAVLIYGMPVGQTLLAASEGAAFGFFPILWIVINAIWVYQMTVATGHFDVLRRSFSSVSDDQRIQAIIIAFSFGALIEALAGFGTPVAVTSVMLMALGFRPLKAAVLALVANTAPVAFGAMATPIITLGKVTELDVDTLGAMVGRQTPILALLVPLALVAIVDGRRGMRATWPAAVVCGVVFAVAQFATSNFLSVPLADVVASLLSAAAVVALVRVWHPANTYTEPVEPAPVAVRAGGDGGPTETGGDTPRGGLRTVDGPPPRGGAGDHPTRDERVEDSRADVVKAYAPYGIIIGVFVLCQIPAVKSLLEKATFAGNWPGLNVVDADGDPSTLTKFTLNLLTTPGTQMLLAGVLTMVALRLSVPRAVKAYGVTLHQLRWAIVTVMTVLALAFVMNLSGQTITLGTFMAAAGGAFALLSPILGWLGVAVTGSDTSANSLFGALQVTAANQAGLSEVLMAASNSSGGVLGKMISPQNLAIAAAAVGLDGKEGDIFRRVVLWSLGFLVLLCALSALQASPVLSWMVPA